MNMTLVLPLLATIVSLIFTLFVLDQYLHRHKIYQLIWTIGLFLFSLAAFAQFLGTQFGWRGSDQLYFRLWFWGGALGTSAFLGMGTIYLMAKPKPARYTLIGLSVAFGVAGVLTLVAPVDTSVLPQCSAQEISVKVAVKNGQLDTVCPNPQVAPANTKNGQVLYALPGYVWGLAPFFNIFGAGFFIFGALQSAWVFWRKRLKPHRAVSNLVIMAGGLVAASAGLFQDAGIRGYAFSLATLLAVILIFIGFLVSIEVFEEFRVPFTNIVIKKRHLVSEQTTAPVHSGS